MEAVVPNIKPPVSSKEPLIDASTEIPEKTGSDDGNFLIEDVSENGIHEITNMMSNFRVSPKNHSIKIYFVHPSDLIIWSKESLETKK